MTKTQTIDHLIETIGFEGLGALVREGLRRRMTVREIARHLNIPMDNAGFYAIGHENEFALEPGERVRLLTDSAGWRGNGTVIEHRHDTVRIKKDGTPPLTFSDEDGLHTVGVVMASRHEVELTDKPELLPEGASFNDDGYIVVPVEPTPTGRQLQFYCPHCRTTHRHGLPEGYRVPHCHKPDSPLKVRGSIYLIPPTLQ